MSQNIAHLNSSATRHPDVESKEDIELWHQEGWHKYKGYTFMALQLRENLEALQTFEVRDDDVYRVTYPKSGDSAI
ncbi:hypothetical protein HOLleu_24598 [Holothuria leucospilota]|uniref:Uncharacterized protein n=1 Tax=Holothuria leucospilota TaxID=206669 RepID=A0A9Q1BRT9_HOLLE|nr:hypothetical protein HOLleu_24598 [Holothuria leucospilota]